MPTELEQMQLVIETIYDILDDTLEKMAQLTEADPDAEVRMSDLDLENFVADDSALLHGADGKRKYDPVKAHAYYMRTRELKGRKKGNILSRIFPTTTTIRDSKDPDALLKDITNTPRGKAIGKALDKQYRDYKREKDLLKQPNGDLQLLKERRNRWKAEQNRRKSESIFNRLKRDSKLEIQRVRQQFDDGIAAIKDLFNG